MHCGADSRSWMAHSTAAGLPHSLQPPPAALPSPTSSPQVDNSDKFVKGDWIRVFVNDGSTTGKEGDGPGERRRRALQQSGFLSLSSEGAAHGGGKVKVVSESVPDWMRDSPVFRAAMQGGVSEEGEGFTPEEAAAAEAEWWAENYPDRVPAAAADDTVVAWLYGDGVADSGKRGAVDKDEVYMSARRVVCCVGG